MCVQRSRRRESTAGVDGRDDTETRQDAPMQGSKLHQRGPTRQVQVVSQLDLLQKGSQTIHRLNLRGILITQLLTVTEPSKTRTTLQATEAQRKWLFSDSFIFGVEHATRRDSHAMDGHYFPPSRRKLLIELLDDHQICGTTGVVTSSS